MEKLSFIIKRDNNAEPHRRFILSVRDGGVCVEAPRFQFLDEALKEIPEYMEEFCVDETIIEVKL